ncbi:hypothetical protein Pmani_036457 [Petrolisthes manimaculis]|uniref:Endoglucanase n=1 Tax=Petrolisthes manimaculis TaxID=1843537 RepID=A0AAE1TM37_9EUCA|nr:hypothetical protein Pmani_036457 [Petrolisthes manimaculis]
MGDCGGTHLDAKGNITSPGYPNKYPKNQLCVYTIKASPDARIKFWCEEMKLQKSVGCTKDWLKVNGVYVCGKTRLRDVYGLGELKVEFRSDKKVKATGFLCHYERVTGTEYVATTTTATTTTYTRQSTSTCNCTLDTKYDYDEVLHKSLLFYEAQRSGVLPTSQRVKWRRDSATDDALDADTQQKVDLEGGYYDAGDYVKFGFPMAGATTVLAWGALEYGDAYTAAGELTYLLAAVKWATDYFLKAHVAPNVFYGQVGNGQLDHSYWGRPEDMTMNRPAYKITQNKPGSDLAGETAAALAAAAILFQQSDSTYSATCLQHARQLYTFANTYRAKYSDSITDAAQYYKSWGGYNDELAWAAAWLYRATGELQYLQQAKQHYTNINILTGEFSWDEKTPGVMVLMSQFFADAADKPTYKGHLEAFCEKMTKNTKRTPKGLLYIRKWGSLRYAANVAFVCLRAADLGINTEQYRSFAEQQIHYMLGDAGRSYVVGFGHNPPQRPHHGSSSCKDPPALCTWDDFNYNGPNPQVLYGALVGGPDENDNYNDVRSDYVSNEVTCDYNAGFQSTVAGLRHHAVCGTNTDSVTTGTTQPTTTGGSQCAQVVQTNEWSGNFQANLVITVPEATTAWSIVLTFSQPISNFRVWIADPSTTTGTTLTLTNKSYNGNQAQGAILTIDFIVTYTGVKPAVTTLTFNGTPLCLQ